MKFLVFSLLLGLARSQTSSTIDPALLYTIFGTPPTPSPPTGPTPIRLEDITVKPTEASVSHVDRDGQSCQCLPYYLCSPDGIAVDANNVSVTGTGLLDIRFGEDNTRICQESVEICCTIPKDPGTPKPMPNPKNVKGCGYRNPNGIGVSFIGANSQFGEFPWVVALLNRSNGSYAGVGVLISPDVVMTGAHIAFKYAAEGLKIRAGEWDTQTNKEIFGYQERDISEIYLHSGFNPMTLQNDIALLRLSDPLELAEHINVICMPEQDESFDAYKNCVANGWGKDVFGREGRYAVILKLVEIDMIPYNTCSMLLKRTRLGSRFKLHDSFVCAGGDEGKDTCQGDGGAPLACPIGDNRHKLTGLVAWGIGCGQKDVPAVYTNVPKYRQWVDNKMAEWGFDTSVYKIN